MEADGSIDFAKKVASAISPEFAALSFQEKREAPSVDRKILMQTALLAKSTLASVIASHSSAVSGFVEEAQSLIEETPFAIASSPEEAARSFKGALSDRAKASLTLADKIARDRGQRISFDVGSDLVEASAEAIITARGGVSIDEASLESKDIEQINRRSAEFAATVVAKSEELASDLNAKLKAIKRFFGGSIKIALIGGNDSALLQKSMTLMAAAGVISTVSLCLSNPAAAQQAKVSSNNFPVISYEPSQVAKDAALSAHLKGSVSTRFTPQLYGAPLAPPANGTSQASTGTRNAASMLPPPLFAPTMPPPAAVVQVPSVGQNAVATQIQPPTDATRERLAEANENLERFFKLSKTVIHPRVVGSSVTPSDEFLELAMMTATVNLHSYSAARANLAQAVQIAEDCITRDPKSKMCQVNFAGIKIDYSTGKHSITVNASQETEIDPFIFATQEQGILFVKDESARSVLEGLYEKYGPAAPSVPSR